MFTNRKNLILFVTALLLVGLISSCTRPSAPEPTATSGTIDLPITPEPTDTPGSSGGEMVVQDAKVDSIDIQLMESFPVQVAVIVRGNFPDGCTTMDQITANREGNNFLIRLTTVRDPLALCTEALVPFEERIELNALGLPAGDYGVNANGVTASFNLAVDNNPPLDETPTVSTVEISGKVWHDLCSVAGGEGSAPPEPSEGCVAAGDGYRANGILEPGEPALEGVAVNLGEGPCPSVGVATITTNPEGRFAFDVPIPGVYCVSIDPQAAPNSGLLLPGEWTQPANGESTITIDRDTTDATRTSINFGWDYQFLPEPEEALDCTNSAKFIDDITVPDDTEFAAGKAFDKTWRLQNTGTCTWTPNYSMVFSDGDQMGGISPFALPGTVSPGSMVDITLRFTAPGIADTYRSEWLLQDSRGNKFGLGKDADESFWVQIVVVETTAGLDLGNPDWRDSFNSGNNWYMLETEKTRFKVADGSLVMTALTKGGGEEWGLSNQPPLDDFFLQATFKTGKTCSGLDRYGLLFRAPEPNAGYVLNISCSGRFRIYKWDGENYSALQEWKASGTILSGPDQTNVIGVSANKRVLKIYINDTLVAELQDNTYREGRIGLLIGSADTKDFQVFVDEVAYWRTDN